MFNIRQKEDLRLAYMLLTAYETAQEGEGDKYKEKMTEIKREIRDFYKKKRIPVTLVKDYGIDGYIILFELPEYLESQQQAEEYFEENEVIKAAPSIYDCTGQAFTSWYKIFKRRNKFFAYHGVSFDV